jgi:3-keto-5-aminohexanoate cleavage enzyme
VAPLVITVAPTGADTTRERTPYVPITPAEIAREAAACRAAGASIVHVHVRDAEGGPAMDLGRYRETLAAVRAAAPDMLVNLTTAGGYDMTEAERLAVVSLRPELCSLDAGSLNFGDGVFLNPPAFLRRLAAAAREHGVQPELECFDVSHVEFCLRLAGEGLLEPPLWFQLVLGAPGGMAATPANLVALRRALPDGAAWSVVAAGRRQTPMLLLAAAMGGHVRVGMEDAVYLSRGVLADSNARFVERIAAAARLIGREPAGPDEARAIVGAVGGAGDGSDDGGR